MTYPSFAYGAGDFVDELPIREAYWSDIGPGELIVDIGACHGLYTLPALASGARVRAYEPIEDFAQMLEHSVALNPGFAGRLGLHRSLLWTADPYPAPLLDHLRGYCLGSGKRLHERFSTIDAECEGLDVTRIKMDVEGAELGVLLGGIETLRRCRPRLVVEDHHGLFNFCAEQETRRRIGELLTSLSMRWDWVPFHSRGFFVSRGGQ